MVESKVAVWASEVKVNCKNNRAINKCFRFMVVELCGMGKMYKTRKVQKIITPPLFRSAALVVSHHYAEAKGFTTTPKTFYL